jgi:hypothetical protein
MRERDEIDEIMARAMRLRAVEANKILTDPVHIQNYVDTYAGPRNCQRPKQRTPH